MSSEPDNIKIIMWELTTFGSCKPKVIIKLMFYSLHRPLHQIDHYVQGQADVSVEVICEVQQLSSSIQ